MRLASSRRRSRPRRSAPRRSMLPSLGFWRLNSTTFSSCSRRYSGLSSWRGWLMACLRSGPVGSIDRPRAVHSEAGQALADALDQAVQAGGLVGVDAAAVGLLVGVQCIAAGLAWLEPGGDDCLRGLAGEDQEGRAVVLGDLPGGGALLALEVGGVQHHREPACRALSASWCRCR